MPDENNMVTDELLHLESKRINVEQLYLDPNNPRFGPRSIIPENRITGQSVQEQVKTSLKNKKIGISDIEDSIEKYGFLTVDRIVVKLIEENKFVVLEGNRRIAALKNLKERHARGITILSDKVLGTLNEIDVLVYNGTNADISLLIQGLRHFSSIKNWPKVQQAKFIKKKFVDEKNMGFNEIGKLLNMTGRKVGMLVRGYYAYLQAREDEDYGDLIDTDKFSTFHEAIFSKPKLKEWLDWDDNSSKFKNIENFKKFLNWITPEEEDSKPRLIGTDVRDVLSKLILEENKDIFDRFDNNEISINVARAEIEKKETKEDIAKKSIDIKSSLREVTNLYNKLSTLPLPQISENTDYKTKFKDLFDKIRKAIDTIERAL